jgi:uncharacterized protein (TIGR02271 family)
MRQGKEIRNTTMLHRSEFIATHPEVRTGMTVYTLDGEKLGTIEQIGEDNIIIEKGWFFRKDFIVSYDDIEDVREDQVILRQRRADFEERRFEDAEETRESDVIRREPGTYEYGTERGEPLSGYQYGREEELREQDLSREEDLRGYGHKEEHLGEEARIPVVEEELEARKREREGEVRIHKDVYTETEHLEVPVQKEEVYVERVPADETRPEELGEHAFRDEDIRIPVREEEVEVTKRPVVKEEIRARKETTTERRDVSGEVRKEDVKVDSSESTEKKRPRK